MFVCIHSRISPRGLLTPKASLGSVSSQVTNLRWPLGSDVIRPGLGQLSVLVMQLTEDFSSFSECLSVFNFHLLGSNLVTEMHHATRNVELNEETFRHFCTFLLTQLCG